MSLQLCSSSLSQKHVVQSESMKARLHPPCRLIAVPSRSPLLSEQLAQSARHVNEAQNASPSKMFPTLSHSFALPHNPDHQHRYRTPGAIHYERYFHSKVYFRVTKRVKYKFEIAHTERTITKESSAHQLGATSLLDTTHQITARETRRTATTV